MKSYIHRIATSHLGVKLRNFFGLRSVPISFSHLQQNSSVSDGFIWRIDKNFKTKFSSELIGSYVGKTRRKDSDTGFWPDPYLTFDFLTKFKPKKSLDLYFGIYNLFDKTFYKSANIRSNQSSVGIEQFSEPGRHLKFGFKYIF